MFASGGLLAGGDGGRKLPEHAIRTRRSGLIPARVPDRVIAEIRSRERAGLIELPKLRLEPGMRVKVLQGPLQDQIGLLAALRPHERVLVLLQLLGGQQRVELARSSVEAINP
jgi:transcription antitermination factor NusG